MGQLFSHVFSPQTDQESQLVNWFLCKGKQIKRGAYGEVFEGTLGTRPVAIKRINQVLRDYAEQNRELLGDSLVKFRNECNLLERAKSPHIVEFIGVFNEGDSVLLVMELDHTGMTLNWGTIGLNLNW
jgi:serine/threonine protein kinase